MGWTVRNSAGAEIGIGDPLVIGAVEASDYVAVGGNKLAPIGFYGPFPFTFQNLIDSSGDYDLGILIPAGLLLMDAIVIVTTPFSGSIDIAVLLSDDTDSQDANIGRATQVSGATTPLAAPSFFLPALSALGGAVPGPSALTVSATCRLHVETTDPSALTAGEADVYVLAAKPQASF